VVFLSNLADAAKALELVGEFWAFASGNWKAIKDTTARYGTPDWVNGAGAITPHRRFSGEGNPARRIG
jgi:hypothetical protein